MRRAAMTMLAVWAMLGCGTARAADPPPAEAVPFAVGPTSQPGGAAPADARFQQGRHVPAAVSPPPAAASVAGAPPRLAGLGPSGSAAARDGGPLVSPLVSGVPVSGVPVSPGASTGARGASSGADGLTQAAASMPAQTGLVPTPSVPASAVPRLPPPPPTAAQQALINTGLASATIRPGEAQIFPVSAGRVNRIVTPFVHAKVSSEAVGGIDVRGGVIYVTPASDGPISMFVTEDGDESVALNVTLVPSRIPPVHLELHLPADIVAQMASRQPVDRSLAERFERGQPFVEMLRDLLRTLALGRVPAGFELRETIPPETTTPRCVAGPARVEFSRGQYLLGASVEVLIGVVSNPGPVGVDFTESWCGSPGVIAVALSPAPFLAPGGAAEIYIVRRLAAADDDRQPVRPTLVGGGG